MILKIGIDLDNVVVNTTEAVIEYLNERIPDLNLKIDDVKEYWLEKNLPAGYSRLVKEAFESKYMWKKVKLIKYAKKYIKKLYQEGHEIYFVTSSLPETLRKKIKHLSRNLSFFPEGYVESHTINIRQKQLLKLDILLDDCMDNLVGDISYEPLCMGYPWNEDDGRVGHVYGWPEAYNVIHYIIDEKEREANA